jgi:Ni/Fe-hydrogenase 1 B-type cytochrome subunit
MSGETRHAFEVWDVPIRWFHRLNVLLVLALLLSGFFIMYRESFHVESDDAKAALKTLHVLIGYAFAVNLLVRIVWGFYGSRHARWRATLSSRVTFRSLRQELRDLRERRPLRHVGRGALGRVSVTIMFAFLLVQAATGLIRASTDLYYPPFGSLVAGYVAAPGVDPGAVSWRNEKEVGDQGRLNRVLKLKLIAGRPHVWTSYLLLAMIILHIAGVTLSEVRQDSGVVSAMISGRQHLPAMPEEPAEGMVRRGPSRQTGGHPDRTEPA